MRLTALAVAALVFAGCESATGPADPTVQYARNDASLTFMLVLQPEESATLPLPELNGGAPVARADMTVAGAHDVLFSDIFLDTNFGPYHILFSAANPQQVNAFFRENALIGGASVYSGQVLLRNTSAHKAVVRITLTWE